MTNEQIVLIKRSWAIFRGIDPLLIGDVFYSRLFMKAPGLKKMFAASMQLQYKKLVNMLNMIVGRIDRLDEVTEEIRQLAIRHVGYGVKIAHYEIVGESLLWTLEQGLGRDWDQATRAAWTTCYQQLSNAMIQAIK